MADKPVSRILAGGLKTRKLFRINHFPLSMVSVFSTLAGSMSHRRHNRRAPAYYATEVEFESETRADCPRQLPTDHDYAVSTREYQSDQPSQKLPRPQPALPPKSQKKKEETVPRS